ncbi:MAG: RnfABCDGE type electron transport complex subunit G [Candidatus Bipolaricaulota bacterium]|nr:RnfABCDGE type electron transport complex subunit G [Candidatus Bipolaricaulota bacterium]
MSKKREFWPVIFLTLVVLISIVALTLTNGITKDKIAQAKQDAITEMLATLFPNMESFTYDEDGGLYTVLAAGEPIGHAFMAQGRGYGGKIDILIGLKPDDKSLQGIKIITQQETPGLGAKIINASFLDQFKGVDLDEVDLSRNGGKIDAITGATISSTAVVNGVKQAITEELGNQHKRGNL